MKKNKFGSVLAAILAVGFLSFNIASAVTFTVTSSVLPSPNSEAFTASVANTAQMIKNRQALPTGVPSPTEARALQGISAETLMASTVPYFAGEFKTSTDKSRGSITVLWIDAIAGDAETLSLGDIVASVSGTDRDNRLGQTVTFGDPSAYGPGALGIRADGSQVEFGTPANLQVKRVIVGILMKWWVVKNVDEVNAVRNYLAQFPDWKVTMVVTAKGSASTFVVPKGYPKLRATVVNNHLMVTLEANGDTTTYGLQSTSTLGGAWISAGTIMSGQTVDLGSVVGGKGIFVRLAPRIATQ